MLKLGVDFGLSNTDVVLLEDNRILAKRTLKTGPARAEALAAVLQSLDVAPAELGGHRQHRRAFPLAARGFRGRTGP